MEKNDYQISVIIPIYNVEEYLKECVDSVINQSLFDQTKVLLINDGSPDKSGEIAKEYAKNYENIFYYEKENGGLSSARNYGMKYVDTEFVMFLDSDDMLEKDAIKHLFEMITKDHEMELVIGDLVMFPVTTPKYQWKFNFGKGDFIIDDLIDYPELMTAPSACNKIFRVSSFLEHEVVFPEGLYFEDAYAILPMMLKAKKIGVCDRVVYLYRQREDNSSIMGDIFLKKKSYLDHLTVNEHIKEILTESATEEMKHVIYNYIARTYAGFFIRIPDSSLFTVEEKTQIFNRLVNLYKGMPDIVEERYFGVGLHKVLMISLKTNDIELFLNHKIYTSGVNILSNRAKVYVKDQINLEFSYSFMLEELEFEKDEIVLYGMLNSNIYYPSEEIRNKINFKLNSINVTIPLEVEYFKRFDKKVLKNNEFYWGIKLKVDYNKIPKRIDEYTIISEVKDLYSGEKMVSKVLTSPFLNKKKGFKDLDNGYRLRFSTFEKGRFAQFNVNKQSKMEVLKYNKEQLFEDKFQLKVGAKMRLMYWLSRPFLKNKNIILLGERSDTYQDNSSVLYDYISENHPELNAYYLIDKKSAAYQKIKNKKNVIEIDSVKHYMYLLNANVLVNAYDIDSYMIPTSYTKSAYFNLFGDLLNYKRLFLQHGIIYNDVSWGVSKFRISNDKVVISNKGEESFFIEKANYQKSDLIKTGLARYDKLTPHIGKINQDKVVLLMPTWREDFAKKSYLKNDLGISDTDFLKTDYYHFYNDLMNNPVLVDYLEKNNIILKFYLHYELNEKIGLFDNQSNNIQLIPNGEEDVQNLLITSDLLITDYSSVFYDFLYMRKPVVFTPFDYEDFYSKHYKHGHVNLLDEKLGSAVRDVESAVTEIIKSLDNNCELSENVKKNVEESFVYKVENTCEALTEEIKYLLKKSKE